MIFWALFMMACVLHIDIDAFFASVEQARNPRLLGKPVAVGSGVVASASYEARKFGLQAGMPLRKARELCPSLRIVVGHAPIYRCFSERIFAICSEYAPAVETYLDEAYCDWNGMERLYPVPEAVASEIRRRVFEETGLTITAGIGRNRMLAKMASKTVKPNGLRSVLPAEEDAFIRDLPVIRLPGVGPKTAKLLGKLNIRTIGEMRLLSEDSLRNLLGMPGLILYARCRGQDTQVISPREIPRSIRRETSFHQDTTDRETVDGVLYYLTERATNTARRLGLKARQVGVKIHYCDGLEEETTRKLTTPTQLDTEVYSFALGLFERLYVRRVALHRVGVALAGLIPDDGFRQLEIFEAGGSSSATEVVADPCVGLRSQRRERTLLAHIDQIRERYGYASVVCGKSLHLLGKLEQDDHGFLLRTSSLTL